MQHVITGVGVLSRFADTSNAVNKGGPIMRSLHGHHHLCVVVADTDRGGRFVHLVMVEGEPVWHLLRYFQSRNLEFSTECTYAHAFGLLIDFIAVRACDFTNVWDRAKLFTAFASAVTYGTIRQGEDPSGLWWHPRSMARARRLVGLVCEVSDWLQSQHQKVPINPFSRVASIAERIVFWRRWNSQKSASLFAHLCSREAARSGVGVARLIALPSPHNRILDRPPSFPEESIERLLFEGFVLAGGAKHFRPWMRWNIRDIMITLLLHYGGLRVSEPFHAWADDVFIDPMNPQRARVLIHHPHDGLHEYLDPVTGRPTQAGRAAALRTLYDRVPLTQLTGKKHAGWKNSLLTDRHRKAFEVFWAPQSAGELFLSLYRIYLEHVRPVGLRHPYLFVTESGEPMGATGFEKNHRRAVQRIGLEASKALGTSSHGHRHAYGQRVNKAGLTEKEIQVALHHVSPLSQAVYTEPSGRDVMAALQRAEPCLPTNVWPFKLSACFKRE